MPVPERETVRRAPVSSSTSSVAEELPSPSHGTATAIDASLVATRSVRTEKTAGAVFGARTTS